MRSFDKLRMTEGKGLDSGSEAGMTEEIRRLL
jgi:hypothetical protein